MIAAHVTSPLDMPAYLRVVVAAVAGVVLALAFPPFGASLLAPVAVAVLTLVMFRQRPWLGGLCGLVAGLAFFLMLLRWLSLIGADAWLALSLFCAAWFGLMGVAIAYLSFLRWWPLWIAGAWLLQEALRDRIPLGGFPWGRLAFAQTATTLTPWAAIAGAAAVTFMTALVGAIMAAAFLNLRSRNRLRGGLLVAGIIVIGVSSVIIPRPAVGQTDGGPSQTVAAVIQGGLPSGEAPDAPRDVLTRHVAETVAVGEAADEGLTREPNIVIWPENAADIDPLRDEASAAAISAAAAAVNAPILVGAVLGIDDMTVANVGIVWDPVTGPGEYYVKQRPVPFGEYVPFRPLLTALIGRFDQVPRDFIAGESSGVLSMGDVVIADVICFEVAYDDVVRGAVLDGGRVIVIQTNNATFAGLGQPEQQVAMSRLRAVEFGRTVLVAATTGISAVIDPTGAVVSEIGEFQSGSMVETIQLRDSLTIAARVGPWPEILASLATMLALGWSIWRRLLGKSKPNGNSVSARDIGSSSDD